MINNDKNKLKQGEEKTPGDEEYEEMEVDNDSPGDEPLPDGVIIDNTISSKGLQEGHGHRKRVKIKKRIRVKKKTSSKRKYKKLIERIIWVAFIIGFVAAVYILINQLGITDDKYKATKKRSMILKLHDSNAERFCIVTNKQNHRGSVNSI